MSGPSDSISKCSMTSTTRSPTEPRSPTPIIPIINRPPPTQPPPPPPTTSPPRTPPTPPMHSYTLHQDFAHSPLDNRPLVDGVIYYSLPQPGPFPPKRTKGFQLNAIYTSSSGVPISPQYSTNVDGTGELKNRPNYTGINPYVSGAQLYSSTASGRQYRWLTNANGSFTCPGGTGPAHNPA